MHASLSSEIWLYSTIIVRLCNPMSIVSVMRHNLCTGKYVDFHTIPFTLWYRDRPNCPKTLSRGYWMHGYSITLCNSPALGIWRRRQRRLCEYSRPNETRTRHLKGWKSNGEHNRRATHMQWSTKTHLEQNRIVTRMGVDLMSMPIAFIPWATSQWR